LVGHTFATQLVHFGGGGGTLHYIKVSPVTSSAGVADVKVKLHPFTLNDRSGYRFKIAYSLSLFVCNLICI